MPAGCKAGFLAFKLSGLWTIRIIAPPGGLHKMAWNPSESINLLNFYTKLNVQILNVHYLNTDLW